MENLIYNPLSVVDALLKENPAANVGAHFAQSLAGHLNHIPLFNNHPEIPPNSLVRFRCMVQDMADPQMYAKTMEEVAATGERNTIPTKYHENLIASAGCELDSTNATFGSRLPSVCTTIPGESRWVHEMYALEETAVVATVPAAANAARGTKRGAEEEEEDTMRDVTDTTERESSRVRMEANGHMHTNGNAAHGAMNGAAKKSGGGDVNAPLHRRPAVVTAMVQFYDESVDNVRVNDTYEVVGVLQLDPEGAFSEPVHELDVPAAPTSLIPHIHCLFALPISALTPCPPLPECYSVQVLREATRGAVMRVVRGDVLACEYVLMAMAAHVFGRTESLCIGSLALNLAGLTSANADRFKNVLSAMFTRSKTISLDIGNLNSGRFVPKKNYERNELVTGPLQLAKNTFLFLDETKVESGTLVDTGVRNLQALSELIVHQRLQYDFEYYPVEFQTDCTTYILSEAKSLLPSSCLVRVQGHEEAVEVDIPEEVWPMARCFVGIVQQIEPTIEPQVREFVEQEFVAARKVEGDASMTPEEFHLNVTLARLLAATHGERIVSQARWREMRAFEIERKSRISTATAAAAAAKN